MTQIPLKTICGRASTNQYMFNSIYVQFNICTYLDAIDPTASRPDRGGSRLYRTRNDRLRQCAACAPPVRQSRAAVEGGSRGQQGAHRNALPIGNDRQGVSTGDGSGWRHADIARAVLSAFILKRAPIPSVTLRNRFSRRAESFRPRVRDSWST
jgi:hypothetical protein